MTMTNDERCAWLQQQIADRDRFIEIDRSIIRQRDAEIDQLRTMPITFTCHQCGEYFVETVERFLNEGRESGEPILAPTLCMDCGHGAED